MRANRFDFLRLVFAGLVFVYHLVVLAALDVSGVWETHLAGLAEFAIQGFFVISGALVYGSWSRSTTLADYAGKRFRRLYPAYAVIILIPAAVALSMGGAFDGVVRYVGANLIFANFLAPTLPGLFEGQRFNVVNGALWTLKIEVMFYLSLVIIGPLIGLLAARRRGFLIAFLCLAYVAGEVWRYSFEMLATVESRPLWSMVARQLPGQMAFFISGIALWIWQDWIRSRLSLVWRVGIMLLAVSVLVPAGEFVRPAGLAALIAGVVWGRGPSLPAAKYGDVSYGLYICHFPIVQALVAGGVFSISPWLGSACAIGLVVVSSFLLWHLVERPALRPDSHYRRG
ncbi:MAG: acyltransferase [Pseudomonadota bacterium]